MADEIRYIPAERGVTRVALMRGDEELSSTLVVPMTMRLGGAVLRMDGIGGVATPEQHRYKGYSRRVLEAAVGFMTAGDAVLSTLYGIPHFYPKYGYATLGPEFVLSLRSLAERDMLPDGIVARRGHRGDLDALQRLYWAETAQAYGALVREDDWWTWQELDDAVSAQTDEVRVVERGGQVMGYAWRGSKAWWMQHWARDTAPGLKIAEAFAADPLAADAVLAACRLWARDLELDRCELAIPPACRVGQAAMFQEACLTAQYHDDAEFMGRVTGLLPLLRALVPELEARWRPASAVMRAFAISIISDNECATITGDDEGIDVSTDRPGDISVNLGPGTLARLVMGGFPPEVVLERAGVPASAWSVLSTLFPQHIPYVYPVDRF